MPRLTYRLDVVCEEVRDARGPVARDQREASGSLVWVKSTHQLFELFGELDRFGNVSRNDFKAYLLRMKVDVGRRRLTYEEIENLLNKFDPDGDGDVTFDEFHYFATGYRIDENVPALPLTEHELEVRSKARGTLLRQYKQYRHARRERQMSKLREQFFSVTFEAEIGGGTVDLGLEFNNTAPGLQGLTVARVTIPEKCMGEDGSARSRQVTVCCS